MPSKDSAAKIPPPLSHGQLYKHRLSLDAAFMVHFCRPMDGYYLVTGYWWNVHNPKRPFEVDHDIIRIKYKDVKNWGPYENP